MSFATAAALRGVKAEATLLIDGIPVLFGTRDGLSRTGAGTIPTLTSVAAFQRKSLQFDESVLDLDKLMVPPAGASVSIAIDSRWNRYFERRRTPRTLLTSAVTKSGTTLNVASTSGFSADGVVYCNREAIYVSAVASTTALTVTRNYCALPGVAAASHNTEAVVSSVPRNLKGRICELRLWVSDTDYQTRYLRLASSPFPNRKNGEWVLTFEDVMKTFDRKIAVGFQGSPVDSATLTTVGTGDATRNALIVAPLLLREFATSTALEGALYLQDVNGGGTIAPIIARAADPTSSPVVDAGEYTIALAGVAPPGPPVELASAFSNMQRVYVFQGSPLLALARVLHSDIGDATNSDFDVLFGISSSQGTLEDGQVECRFGAAIPAGLIALPSDTDAETRGLWREVPGWSYVLGGNGPVSLVEFMRDVLFAIGAIAYVNASGALAIKGLDSAYEVDTYAATILDSDILASTEPRSLDDEDEIVHTVTLKCNWSTPENGYKGTVSVRDMETAETYRDTSGTLELERRGLWCIFPGNYQPSLGMRPPAQAMDFQTLAVDMDRFFSKRAPGVIKLDVRLPFGFATLMPGDLVRLTWEQFNAFDGSTIAAKACLVVGVQLDIDAGCVNVKMHVERTAKPIAPTAVVASYSAGPPRVITLNTAGKFLPGSTPGQYFAVGDTLRLFDASSSPQYAAGGTAVVQSRTDTTITLVASFSTTPAIGDLVTLAPYDSATGTTPNAAQALYQKQYAFMAGTGLSLGSALAAGDEWG